MEDKYHKIPNEYIPALCMSAICIIYVYQQKKYKFYVGVGRAKKIYGSGQDVFFSFGSGRIILVFNFGSLRVGAILGQFRVECHKFDNFFVKR